MDVVSFLVGDPVRLRSSLSISDACERLESRFDWVRHDGRERGWAFGRYFIVTANMSDYTGAVLYLRLSPDRLGTRIRGRGGSGLFVQYVVASFGFIAVPLITAVRCFLVGDIDGFAWLPGFVGGTLAFLILWRWMGSSPQPLVELVASELNALPDG